MNKKSSPIQSIVEHPDPLGNMTLSEDEIRDLIEVLGFYIDNHLHIVVELMGPVPSPDEKDEEAQGWFIGEQELSVNLDKAEHLIKRLQKINMPQISEEMYNLLKKQYPHLSDQQMGQAIRAIQKKHLE